MTRPSVTRAPYLLVDYLYCSSLGGSVVSDYTHRKFPFQISKSKQDIPKGAKVGENETAPLFSAVSSSKQHPSGIPVQLAIFLPPPPLLVNSR